MGRAERERLNLLFEMETIKCPLMNYISPGVSLKVVADLGSKDQSGNKKRFYEETIYPSNKYSNVDKLVSANFRLNTYLVLEYPNPLYVSGSNELRSHSVLIRAYAMDDIVSKIKEFNDNLFAAYRVNSNNELCLISDKIKTVTVYPTSKSSLTFKTDIFENTTTGNKEIGVQLTINDEFSCIISAETVWPEFVYRITKCDLTMLGFQMIQSYMALLPGMAVNELGSSKYSSISKYSPYWGEDPEEIANSPNSVKVSGRPVTKDEKKKSFFETI